MQTNDSPSLYLCNQLQHLNGKKIIIIMKATFAVAKGSLKIYIYYLITKYKSDVLIDQLQECSIVEIEQNTSRLVEAD